MTVERFYEQNICAKNTVLFSDGMDLADAICLLGIFMDLYSSGTFALIDASTAVVECMCKCLLLAFMTWRFMVLIAVG